MQDAKIGMLAITKRPSFRDHDQQVTRGGAAFFHTDP